MKQDSVGVFAVGIKGFGKSSEGRREGLSLNVKERLGY